MNGNVRDVHVLELIAGSESPHHGIEGGYKLFVVGWKDPGYVRRQLSQSINCKHRVLLPDLQYT
jgi:hypothetical protein